MNFLGYSPSSSVEVKREWQVDHRWPVALKLGLISTFSPFFLLLKAVLVEQDRNSFRICL